MADEAGRAMVGRRMFGAFVAMLLLASPAGAGRPDYSHLSDAELRQSVVAISGWLAAMASSVLSWNTT